MGLRKVEQSFSSFFAQIFGMFDDFSKFNRAFGIFSFKKSSNMAKIWQKMRKPLFNLPSTHFSMVLQIPKTRVSGTYSTTITYYSTFYPGKLLIISALENSEMIDLIDPEYQYEFQTSIRIIAPYVGGLLQDQPIVLSGKKDYSISRECLGQETNDENLRFLSGRSDSSRGVVIDKKNALDYWRR